MHLGFRDYAFIFEKQFTSVFPFSLENQSWSSLRALNPPGRQISVLVCLWTWSASVSCLVSQPCFPLFPGSAVRGSKYQTWGVSPACGFGSVFYERRRSEVRVSLTPQINRLLVGVYSRVRVMYVLRFKRGVKIWSSYLCPPLRRDGSYGPPAWCIPSSTRDRREIYKEARCEI